MGLYCIKCLVFTKKIGKISLYSCGIDYGFKTFETIDEEKLSYLLESLI